MPGPLLVLPLKAACFVGWSGWSSAFYVCVWNAWEREAVMGLPFLPLLFLQLPLPCRSLESYLD